MAAPRLREPRSLRGIASSTAHRLLCHQPSPNAKAAQTQPHSRLTATRKRSQQTYPCPAPAKLLCLSTMIDPPSPCTQICRIAPGTKLCEGCGRSLAEIAGWPNLSPQAKLAVLNRLAAAKRH